MKRSLPLIFFALVIAFAFSSCASAPGYTSYVSIKGVDCPMAEFAAGDIITALDDDGIGVSNENPAWTIRFAEMDPSLGEQSYRVEVLGRIIEITGGDERGLMYGGLEVAEQIALYGIDSISSVTGEPFMKNRGMLCPVPMDLRTPSYNTPGTNAQLNMGNVWEIEFWHEYLDTLARNRVNKIQVWTVNSFASMVKVEGYEDIALDDVWRTTLPLDNNYRGDLTNAIRPEDWENHEVVKVMTIDEKIGFWREVMSYAKDRGIDFLFLFRHVYTIAEQGKYGITDDLDNPVLQDYLYKSAKTFIQTYPDLAGFGINPGENMGWDNSAEGQYNNLKWMHDIYVPAINEALAETPDRKFELMVQKANLPEYAELYSDVNCELSFIREYTSVHMYASSTPQDSFVYANNIPEGTGLWLNCRNEDMFDLRWGDPDFMIEFVNNMPADKVLGLVTGSDGYFYGYDYSSTDPDFQGQLYMQKHWYNYMLLMRLMYDNTLTKERIFDIFSDHYGNMDGVEELFETTSVAGKIIPQVQEQYFSGNGDYTWFVAGSWSHPSTNGYLGVKRWMRSNNPYPTGNAMSIEEYAIRLANDDDSPYTTKTPQEISDILKEYSETTLAGVERIRGTVTKSKKMSFAEKEFWALVSDDEAMAYLGLYYAEKILGAVDLRVYNETSDTRWQDSSVAHLTKSAEYFGKYAEIVSANYVPQFLSRVGYFDVNEIHESVKKDIEVARKWRIIKISSGYVTPSKSDYFNNTGSGK